jgi:NADH:ubiquinone oxidoreductase subunit E
VININICIGSGCHLKGSYNVIKEMQKYIDEKELSDTIKINGSFCLGNCTKAVSVQIDGEDIVSVNENIIPEFFEKYILPKL